MAKGPLFPHVTGKGQSTEENFKEQQRKRLPQNLGHGWFADEPMFASDPVIFSEADHIRSSGHHVAIFNEGNTSGVRIWHSEVSSDDPTDESGEVYRWFDYRRR